MTMRGVVWLGGLLAASGAAPADPAPEQSSVDALLPSVYSVTMARGDEAFMLGPSDDSPPEAVDEPTFLRLIAQAYCLEMPDELPIAVDDTANVTFTTRLEKVREHLAGLAVVKTPAHVSDPDFDGGFSAALRDELQSAIAPVLWQEGVLLQLKEAYVADLHRPESCMERLTAFLLAPPEPLAPEDQWKAVIDVCSGRADDVADHIVYHFGAAEVAPERRRAIRAVVANEGFRDCLAKIIQRDQPLARRVMRIDGRTGPRESSAVQESVHAAWAAAGLSEVIEEANALGRPGQALREFLAACDTNPPSSPPE